MPCWQMVTNGEAARLFRAALIAPAARREALRQQHGPRALGQRINRGVQLMRCSHRLQRSLHTSSSACTP